jgi:hypothetical protein
MVPVLRHDSEFPVALRAADSADAPGQRPFFPQPPPGRLLASVGQLETGRPLANTANERSPCTDPPRRIHEHHRVRALKAVVGSGAKTYGWAAFFVLLAALDLAAGIWELKIFRSASS